MKISTSTPKSSLSSANSQADNEWTSAKLEQANAPADSECPEKKKLSYKEKFRAKVKTVLRNVRDLEIEEYDQQRRKANEENGSQTLDTNQIIFTGSALGVEDDPVDSTNVVKFARKAFLILGLQLLLATVWISWVCPNEELYETLYSDSAAFIILACLALVAIFTTLYFSKKVFGSYKAHIAISSAMTLSLGYLFGALALLISYKTMIVSFVMSLSFIVGLVVYCKLTGDGYFNPKKSTMSGCLALFLVTACIYWWTNTGPWTILVLYMVSNFFGIALVFKTHLAAENAGSQLLMKHYIFFAMLLYIDFVKAMAQAAIATLNYKAKPQPPVAAGASQADTHSNLFAFTLDAEPKCL